MQGIKIHGYYGVSIPMLLGAPEDVVHGVLSAATNGFSSRLLHNLYEEGRSLDYTLYKSGRFNFAIDETSRATQNLIRYTDFSVAYNKHMEALNAGNTLPPEESTAPLPNLEETLPGLTDLFSDISDAELPSLGLGDIPGETSLFASDDLPTFDTLDLSKISEATSKITSEVTSEVTSEATSGIECLEISEISLDDIPVSGASPVLESDGLDTLLQTESGDINTRILISLQYNADFYNAFSTGDYTAVSREILNWVPVEYTTLRSLRFNTKDAKTLETKQELLINIEASIAELEGQALTELSRVRLTSFLAERDELRSAITELEAHTKYLTPIVLEVIKRERERLPKRLINMYYDFHQNSQIMSEAEYTIVSSLHEVCSRITGPNGETRLEQLIFEIKDVRNRNVMNSPRFFNQEFSRLSTKEMPSQLMTFNKQYKAYLDGFSGQDLNKVLEDGVASCKILLESDNEDYKQLLSLFTTDLQQGNTEMSDNDPKRFELKGSGNIDYAVEIIMEKPEMYSSMMLGSEPPDPAILRSMIELLYDSNKIIELCKSRESFTALYRIFHFITKYSGDTMLSQLGMLFVDSNGEVTSYTLEEWREFTARFGILGFYNFPLQMFVKCCDINVLVSNSKHTVIRKEQRPRLYANIGIIQRFLLSRQVALASSYPIAAF